MIWSATSRTPHMKKTQFPRKIMVLTRLGLTYSWANGPAGSAVAHSSTWDEHPKSSLTLLLVRRSPKLGWAGRRTRSPKDFYINCWTNSSKTNIVKINCIDATCTPHQELNVCCKTKNPLFPLECGRHGVAVFSGLILLGGEDIKWLKGFFPLSESSTRRK